jgi:flagella basal body P-ring formation protein FlgA
MESIKLTGLLAGLLLAAAAGTSISASAEKPLRLYLPQEVRLDGDTAELGRVGILLGDPALIEKARSISLGTFAMEGQWLLVDRNTILSRLATSGIRPAQVQLLGSETVRIGRHEVTLSADRITACAQTYLERTLADQKGVVLTLIRAPGSLVLSSDSGAVELTVSEETRQGGGIRKVHVAILQNGKTVGGEDVFFSVRYQIRRVIAAAELPAGTTLTADNIRVETYESDQPEPSGWAVPYGMVTRQRVAGGAMVSDALLEIKQDPVVIRRRQNVMVRIDSGLLYISAPGEAMDDGRVGDVIRVRRGQRPQERIIVCRVQADGTVEPVL